MSGSGTPVGFPDAEPWPEPVDGAELLDEMERVIARLIVASLPSMHTMPLWCLHTWLIASFDYSAILLIQSPTKACGKSRLVALLSMLSFRAVAVSSATPASIYRMMDEWSPMTLLIDEMDSQLQNAEKAGMFRNILNQCYWRPLAFMALTQMKGKEHKPHVIPTFGPKCIAGLSVRHVERWDTVRHRSIPITLSRATKSQLATLGRFNFEALRSELVPLLRRIRRWTVDAAEEMRTVEPDIPADLDARQGQIWTPLLAIADRAGGHWPRRAREAAIALHGVADDEDEDIGVRLLAHTSGLFSAEATDRFHSATLVEKLSAIEDAPWADWDSGRGLSVNNLASLLRPFGIQPCNVRIGSTSKKGYYAASFVEAFTAYAIPLPQGATALHDTEAGNVEESE